VPYFDLVNKMLEGGVKREVQDIRAHRLLTGRPVCLLTLRYREQVNIMPIAWVSPISLAPLLIGLSIFPGRYSHDMLAASEELVLNIPGRGLAEQVLKLGSVSGGDTDKAKLAGLTLDSGRRVQVPWVVECLAHLECMVVQRLAPGDHTLFIAQVLGAWAEEEAFDGRWLAPQDNEELIPLIHMGERRFALLGKQLEIP
jgi:flavin reductase (DIM6/NTAB) family NADH-FMN oxidoreductase RutF